MNKTPEEKWEHILNVDADKGITYGRQVLIEMLNDFKQANQQQPEPNWEKRSIAFIKGNYSNTCTYCGNDIEGTDKLWFMCEDCCNDIDKAKAIRKTRKPDFSDEDINIPLSSFAKKVGEYKLQKVEPNGKKLSKNDWLVIRSKIVDLMPVGGVKAWDVIKAVQSYLYWFDNYSESKMFNSAPQPSEPNGVIKFCDKQIAITREEQRKYAYTTLSVISVNGALEIRIEAFNQVKEYLQSLKEDESKS